jgi:septal ring factor EnvC (AmiA/AmiB activator)
MDGKANLTAELSALTDDVEQSTRRLHALRDRAPELDGVVDAADERLAQRTAELARSDAGAQASAERIAVLRGRLGAVEDRLRSFRRRMADLANIADPD